MAMAFSIQPEESLSLIQGLLHVLLGQVDSGIAHLATQDEDPVEAVHETRKALKRIRTTLRLLRRALGGSRFKQENRHFAELGRKLAPARDAHILVKSAERLAKHAAGSPYAEAVAPVLLALKERLPVQPLDEELLHELVSSLQSARERLEGYLKELSPRGVRASFDRGVRRMMKKGKAAYALAYAEPSDDNFHSWRKRVKDLYYSTCLLHLTRPNKLAPLIDTLDGLSDSLGDEHDLSILASTLHRDPRSMGGAVPVALVLQLISRRREELRQELRHPGHALYRKGAKQMARRLTSAMP